MHVYTHTYIFVLLQDMASSINTFKPSAQSTNLIQFYALTLEFRESFIFVVVLMLTPFHGSDVVRTSCYSFE